MWVYKEFRVDEKIVYQVGYYVNDTFYVAEVWISQDRARRAVSYLNGGSQSL